VKDAVAAARDAAIAHTAIGLDSVAVIALLAGLSLYDAIAAHRARARIRAFIRIDGVPVVTFFVCLHVIVTATRFGALVGAGIGIVEVCVVALLFELDDTVPAARVPTLLGAGIRVVIVTVIALLATVRLGDAITTPGLEACVGTIVVVDVVAIVAGFPVLHDPVTAQVGTSLSVDEWPYRDRSISPWDGAFAAAARDEWQQGQTQPMLCRATQSWSPSL
jgi:hypothetical protein